MVNNIQRILWQSRTIRIYREDTRGKCVNWYSIICGRPSISHLPPTRTTACLPAAEVTTSTALHFPGQGTHNEIELGGDDRHTDCERTSVSNADWTYIVGAHYKTVAIWFKWWLAESQVYGNCISLTNGLGSALHTTYILHQLVATRCKWFWSDNQWSTTFVARRINCTDSAREAPTIHGQCQATALEV